MTTERNPNLSTTLDDDCIVYADESCWQRLRELLASAANSKDLLRLLYWRARSGDWSRNEAHQTAEFIRLLEKAGRLSDIERRLRTALEGVVR